jgi:hypothetical protein
VAVPLTFLALLLAAAAAEATGTPAPATESPAITAAPPAAPPPAAPPATAPTKPAPPAAPTTAPPAAPAPSASPAATPTSPAAGALSRPAPVIHVVDEKERVELEQIDRVRLSLPTQADVDAWANPGLRVQLGYGYAVVQGAGPAWSFRSQTAILRPSFRLDRRWALGVSLLYGTGPNGVRWSVTAEPTFFVWRQLSIAAGLGIGGLFISRPDVSTGTLSTENVSRTLSDADHLSSCTGSALTSALRAEYLFVVGPLFASGPFAQLEAQWTECQQSFGEVDQETGKSVVLTQWWRQQAATFGWWFAWR